MMQTHTLREVKRQLRESGAAGVVTLLLVAVATTWGGALWSFRQWVSSELLAPQRTTQVVAVMREGADGGALAAALGQAFQDLEGQLSGSVEVRQQLGDWFPELSSVLLSLDEGVFPALLEVEVAAADEEAVLRWLREQEGVSLAASSREWEGRLEQATSRVFVIGAGLALALLLACGVLVLLVVRLLVLAHADEIAIMRLIGAHEKDIRLPYMVCGCVFGVLGGILGVAILLGMLTALAARLPGLGLSPAVIVVLPIMGGIAGSLGAMFGLATLPEEP